MPPTESPAWPPTQLLCTVEMATMPNMMVVAVKGPDRHWFRGALIRVQQKG